MKTKEEKMLEDAVEQALRDECTRRHWWCLKLPAGLYPGIPDRLVVAQCPVVAFVETKRPKGGRMQDQQPTWRRRLERLGWGVHYPRTIGQVNELMNDLDYEVQQLHQRMGEYYDPYEEQAEEARRVWMEDDG